MSGNATVGGAAPTTTAGRGPGGPTARVREIIVASRPLSWINTALPFLATAWSVERGVTPAIVLGFAYFLVPFNLLMYGVNDIFDYASDLANPRKRSIEGGLVPPDRRRPLVIAIVLTNVPLLVALAVSAPAAGTVATLAAAAAAIVYSAPPLRTKVVPVADSLTSASHFVLPAVAGFLVAGLTVAELPWLVLLAFTAWAVASHALGAIQDIVYDREAGIGSIATAFGARATAWVSLGGYAVAVAVAAGVGGAPGTGGPAGLIVAIALASYLLLPTSVLFDPTERQARRAWRSFLGLNLIVGFVLTQILLRAWDVTSYTPSEALAGAAIAGASVCLASLLATELSPAREHARTAGDRCPSTCPG